MKHLSGTDVFFVVSNNLITSSLGKVINKKPYIFPPRNEVGSDTIFQKNIKLKISGEKENEVTMYAPAPGYDENLYIGVWLGILEMIGITSGKVEELGDHTYKIIW